MSTTDDNTLGIPVDIAVRVLDVISSDRATLKACCLVNRAFSAYAQSLLFRSVKLEKYRVFKPYSQVIDSSTERGRALGQLTRELTFICDSDVYVDGAQLALRDLVKVLPHLPKLEHLELHLRGKDFTPSQLDVLSRASSITSLHLHNSNKFGQTNVHDILASLPQITRLYLYGSAFRIVSGREPLNLVLSELHWHIDLDPSAQELKWLLGESSNLRALSIVSPHENTPRSMPERLLPLLLEQYGRNLHTLRLSDRIDSLDFVQSSCPILSELSLKFWPAPSVLRTLPRGLTHLALAGPGKTTANESALRELMSCLGGLPHIHTLTWLTGDGVSSNERTEFVRFCDARGIRIVEPPPCVSLTEGTRPRFRGPPETLILRSLGPRPEFTGIYND
ncbi:hypothetical protein RSOLAG22IIIB_00608 [Rhizoctonia solani]|uniref:F-box domain-containing protein n=1 Tax=Rhizoctonia solani TaxID=456999 RepID=A0A0K6FVP1_9AGAM|nr:hypothetical protein RSOLAG22IIIB_00608 [Rhizoctonia solani]